MTQPRSQYGLGKERTKEHLSAFESCQNQQFARSGLFAKMLMAHREFLWSNGGTPRMSFHNT